MQGRAGWYTDPVPENGRNQYRIPIPIPKKPGIGILRRTKLGEFSEIINSDSDTVSKFTPVVKPDPDSEPLERSDSVQHWCRSPVSSTLFSVSE